MISSWRLGTLRTSVQADSYRRNADSSTRAVIYKSTSHKYSISRARLPSQN